MEPWYKTTTPRKEVREGRSFNPDEFAIALEQVIAGTAPEDYRDSMKFFDRTCFTRALKEHAGMILWRLAGRTENTAPVLTLITQFGGGKTHNLTALYHLVHNRKNVAKHEGVQSLLREAGLSEIPQARVAVFVGNAWDPEEGHETPWIDIARQLAGDAGVAALGPAARTAPPGTEKLWKVFAAAEAPILILMDEVLNFFNRHRNLAEPCYAFFDNLVRALTGITHGAALISLPRSQIEMTDWDLQWQERITKVFKRVAKDLITNDESEISEVVRRRLFEDLGSDRVRKNVAKAYADWCFERRAQLPPEWTAVDTAITEARAREFLQRCFETCYPFHPATLTVFQRKWQTLPQYQQTRGTLAMLAQWISLAYREGYQRARREALITLGSAPLEVLEFRAVILGQLGEARLDAAIEADIAGPHSHARALDADTTGPLKDIHRRVGSAILFESSGGMVDKVAHLPELRFAIGEPGLDTTSIDTAVDVLERKAFYLRKVGTLGFRFGSKPTLKKVVNDRRASLDEGEVARATRELIRKEFDRGSSVPPLYFPEDGSAIADTPRLTVVVMDPGQEWNGSQVLRERLATWIRERGGSPRLYPAALLFALRKPGRDLQEKVELWLAWKRVAREIDEGTLGAEFDRAERTEVTAKVRDAEEAARDEVWASYRFVVLADRAEPDGLKVIDLGAGHASAAETLVGRIIAALKANGLLSESIGAGYLERNWPPALKDSGAWPLSSLRQSFLNGTLTRLLDPDAVLRTKIVEFVARGDFGLASGARPDGTFELVWFQEAVDPEEIVFDPDVFLLMKARAKALKEVALVPQPTEAATTTIEAQPSVIEPTTIEVALAEAVGKRTFHITGVIPPEVWNRLGTKLLPKLRSGSEIQLNVDFTVTVDAQTASAFEAEVRQALQDLGLAGEVKIEGSKDTLGGSA